jgi:ribosomal-protein-serine acetyltransferase
MVFSVFRYNLISFHSAGYTALKRLWQTFYNMSKNLIPIAEGWWLELLTAAHAPALLDLVNTNRQHLRTWLPWVDRMTSEEQFARLGADAESRAAAGTDYGYVLVEQGQLAGRIGLYQIDAANQYGSIGYWLSEHLQGRGIMGMVCHRFIAHCFTHWPINRIEIRCATENLRSRAIPDRLGFTLEGIIRQGEFVNQRFVDLYCYSLLKSEWAANNA